MMRKNTARRGFTFVVKKKQLSCKPLSTLTTLSKIMPLT